MADLGREPHLKERSDAQMCVGAHGRGLLLSASPAIASSTALSSINVAPLASFLRLVSDTIADDSDAKRPQS